MVLDENASLEALRSVASTGALATILSKAVSRRLGKSWEGLTNREILTLHEELAKTPVQTALPRVGKDGVLLLHRYLQNTSVIKDDIPFDIFHLPRVDDVVTSDLFGGRGFKHVFSSYESGELDYKRTGGRPTKQLVYTVGLGHADHNRYPTVLIHGTGLTLHEGTSVKDVTPLDTKDIISYHPGLFTRDRRF